MATKIIMPKQGLQMTEGTVTAWLVKEGGQAIKGEPLFEIETDKLSITINSSETGTLLKILHGEGETVPITQTIAIVGTPGEDISSLLDGPAEAPKESQTPAPQAAKPPAAVPTAGNGGRIFVSPRAKALAQEKGIDYLQLQGSGPDGMIVEKDVMAYTGKTVSITPLAKKLAELDGVDVSNISGSGAYGKIVKADVRNAAGEGTASAGSNTLIPFAGMRKVIADRMVDSLHVAAQTTHQISVDMTEAAQLREANKQADKKVSYNDIIAVAVCRALKDYPIMNSELTEQGILLKDSVNLGIAVALDNGLIVPVIKDADKKSVEQIGIETRDLADKAKTGKLKPDEYKGGSFTISNLGMFGLDAFVAIINRPESGILAVGKITKTPVVTEYDEVAIRPIVVLTLTYDHRVVDGAPAARFLAQVKAYLEQPYLLI